MADYKVIDMETWPRRSHWKYYTQGLKAGVSVTSRIDVTELLDWCHENNRKFFPCLLYLVTRTVNSYDFMKMLMLPDGNPAVWNVVHPNFTIFHEDDETFSDLWMEYDENFETFYHNYLQLMAKYKDFHGIKIRDGQPRNFFCIGGTPALDFTGLTTYVGGGAPALFPILDYGKYKSVHGRMVMPLSINFAHAAMDGYHVAKFLEGLQNNLKHVSELFTCK